MLFGSILLLSSVAPAHLAEDNECPCTIFSVDIVKDFQFGLNGYFSRNISLNGECDIDKTTWTAYDSNGNQIANVNGVGSFAKITFPAHGTYDVCVTHELVVDNTPTVCLVETYCESFTI